MSEKPGPSHRFVAHTAEVRLELTAPTCEQLFAEAGRALAELMLGELPAADRSASAQEIELHGRDRAGLLVDWINELVFLSETTKQVFTRFEVERADETTARGRAWGLSPEALKTPVKAATLHEVVVEHAPSGWRGSVVLDV